MNPSDPLELRDPPERARLAALLKELKAPSSWQLKGTWSLWLCIAAYGAIAVSQGTEFAMQFFGMLVIVFAVQETNDRRARKQVDLIVDLIREVEKKNRGDT